MPNRACCSPYSNAPEKNVPCRFSAGRRAPARRIHCSNGLYPTEYAASAGKDKGRFEACRHRGWIPAPPNPTPVPPAVQSRTINPRSVATESVLPSSVVIRYPMLSALSWEVRNAFMYIPAHSTPPPGKGTAFATPFKQPMRSISASVPGEANTGRRFLEANTRITVDMVGMFMCNKNRLNRPKRNPTNIQHCGQLLCTLTGINQNIHNRRNQYNMNFRCSH